METPTQPVPGYYVWEIPGKPIAVHLHLGVVDRVLAEVMRGFIAIPKRGAEVGGVLIGSVEPGDPAIVRIENYEAVECDYTRGPSYLFSDDLAAFGEVYDRWAPGESRPACAVGYFRSHTRDGFALAPEDIELLDQFFPEAWNIALLIRPFGTKVSTAGFFFREGETFQKSTPLEFPFRRLELTGGKTTPRRSMIDGRRERAAPTPPSASYRTELAHPEQSRGNFAPAALPEERADNGEEFAPPQYQTNLSPVTTPSRLRVRSWIWIPLSFIFLVLGALLGFQTALSLMPGGGARDFSLGLSVARSDDNLSVRWDRAAPVIHGAQRGTLEIEDGQITKSVDLDPAQLQNGSVIYHNSSNDVKFRLVVYPRARMSVTETMEWKR